MNNCTTGAQSGSGGKGLFELIIATIPAVLLYFFGWAFLHFYLNAFGIEISELDLDLQTIFIYSVPPLRALIRLYWLWLIIAGLVLFICALQWLFPQFYTRIVELPPIVQGLGLFALVIILAIVSVPMIRSVAADAASRKWNSGTSLPTEAIVKGSEARDNSLWHENYRRCSSRRALDLVFADKESYYMLCVSNIEKTGVVFEVRRETGLVSVRFVEP